MSGKGAGGGKGRAIAYTGQPSYRHPNPTVIPVQTGIQKIPALCRRIRGKQLRDSRLRGNDGPYMR